MEEPLTYDEALRLLSSLISGKRRSDGQNWSHAFDMMQGYLERLGLDKDLDKLSVIHVAGTKGKGSTCAMVERVLRQCGYRTGLYTSPHLLDVRERIRIDGQPVDEATFLRHLSWCYRTLQSKADGEVGMAAYFRFLTLLAFRVFLDAGVDVVVLEVGIGGRLDATNCVRRPVACGITPLGFDHQELLGETLPEIAREKAGIYKVGAAALTVSQPDDALAVLQQKAADVGVPLVVVPGLDTYRVADGSALSVGLAGKHQETNASLAVALAAEWETRSPRAAARFGEAAAQRAASVQQGVVPVEYAAGLAAASWPGRGQVVDDLEAGRQPAELANGSTAAREGASRLTFYLDGAHTPESMATCAHWFADAVAAAVAEVRPAEANGVPPLDKPPAQRLLLFNCMQERDPLKLLRPLADTLAARRVQLAGALFVPPDSTYGSLASRGPSADLSWQQQLRGTWEAVGKWQPAAAAAGRRPQPLLPLPLLAGVAAQDVARGAVLPNLQITVDWLRRCVRAAPALRLQVLVTGSLYVVGDLLCLLQPGSPPSGAPPPPR